MSILQRKWLVLILKYKHSSTILFGWCSNCNYVHTILQTVIAPIYMHLVFEIWKKLLECSRFQTWFLKAEISSSSQLEFFKVWNKLDLEKNYDLKWRYLGWALWNRNSFEIFCCILTLESLCPVGCLSLAETANRAATGRNNFFNTYKLDRPGGIPYKGNRGSVFQCSICFFKIKAGA